MHSILLVDLQQSIAFHTGWSETVLCSLPSLLKVTLRPNDRSSTFQIDGSTVFFQSKKDKQKIPVALLPSNVECTASDLELCGAFVRATYRLNAPESFSTISCETQEQKEQQSFLKLPSHWLTDEQLKRDFALSSSSASGFCEYLLECEYEKLKRPLPLLPDKETNNDDEEKEKVLEKSVRQVKTIFCLFDFWSAHIDESFLSQLTSNISFNSLDDDEWFQTIAELLLLSIRSNEERCFLIERLVEHFLANKLRNYAAFTDTVDSVVDFYEKIVDRLLKTWCDDTVPFEVLVSLAYTLCSKFWSQVPLWNRQPTVYLSIRQKQNTKSKDSKERSEIESKTGKTKRGEDSDVEVEAWTELHCCRRFVVTLANQTRLLQLDNIASCLSYFDEQRKLRMPDEDRNNHWLYNKGKENNETTRFLVDVPQHPFLFGAHDIIDASLWSHLWNDFELRHTIELWVCGGAASRALRGRRDREAPYNDIDLIVLLPSDILPVSLMQLTEKFFTFLMGYLEQRFPGMAIVHYRRRHVHTFFINGARTPLQVQMSLLNAEHSRQNIEIVLAGYDLSYVQCAFGARLFSPPLSASSFPYPSFQWVASVECWRTVLFGGYASFAWNVHRSCVLWPGRAAKAKANELTLVHATPLWSTFYLPRDTRRSIPHFAGDFGKLIEDGKYWDQTANNPEELLNAWTLPALSTNKLKVFKENGVEENGKKKESEEEKEEEEKEKALQLAQWWYRLDSNGQERSHVDGVYQRPRIINGRDGFPLYYDCSKESNPQTKQEDENYGLTLWRSALINRKHLVNRGDQPLNVIFNNLLTSLTDKPLFKEYASRMVYAFASRKDDNTTLRLRNVRIHYYGNPSNVHNDKFFIYAFDLYDYFWSVLQKNISVALTQSFRLKLTYLKQQKGVGLCRSCERRKETKCLRFQVLCKSDDNDSAMTKPMVVDRRSGRLIPLSEVDTFLSSLYPDDEEKGEREKEEERLADIEIIFVGCFRKDDCTLWHPQFRIVRLII